MKTRKGRIFTLLLSLTVALTMCLGTIAPVFAAEELAGPSKVAPGDGIVEALDSESDSFEASMADATPVYINSGATIATDPSKIYVMPTPSSGVGTVKVVVKTAGYLTMSFGGFSQYSSGTSFYGCNYKTKGFKDYGWADKDDATRFIAVKKGTYTFSVKPIGNYALISAKFTKVKQAKYGTKKGKAATLKAKKAKKGLIITDAKKTHWYKFKNKKTKKVRVYVNAKESGSSIMGIKVSMYDKRGLIGSRTIYSPGGKLTIKPYTFGKGGKLIKGNYWIKIQSYNKGNGYFTVKWK